MAEWKKYDETTFTDFGSVGETMPAEGGEAGGFDSTLPADGTDYRLYEGYSYIGRDPAKNQVAIPDDHISSVPSARILYDTGSRKFFINECNGARNPVYLNGDLFDGRVELKPYDMIKMGNTRLLFVPLCTEKVSWEE